MLKDKNLESLNNIPGQIFVISILMYLGTRWTPGLYSQFNGDIIQNNTRKAKSMRYLRSL